MNIKREACRAIAAAISAGVSSLTGKCDAGQADVEVLASYPFLRVIPRRFTFQPFDDEEIDIASTTRQLVRRGDFDGDVELRIYEQSQLKRGELEEDVLQFLLATDGGGGSIWCQTAALTLGGVATIYPAPVLACLDEEDWREELAFDKKRFSFLTLSVQYPALVVKNAPNIETLYLEIARDLNAANPEESGTVNEAGDYTPA